MNCKWIPVLVVMAAAAITGCKKESKAADYQAGDPPIFREDIFAGIPPRLDDYYNRADFQVEKTVIPEEEITKELPLDHYLAAENDDIIIGFWQNPWEDTYQIGFLDVKRKNDTYFLGRLIGLKAEDIFSRYTRPAAFRDAPNGENHIMYTSADGKRFINLWVEDNEVIRAGFGYYGFE